MISHSDIMIVDDNPSNLKLLEDMLHLQGHEVRSFPLGLAGAGGGLEESAGLDLAGRQHA